LRSTVARWCREHGRCSATTGVKRLIEDRLVRYFLRHEIAKFGLPV
jgi:hypothetical protein